MDPLRRVADGYDRYYDADQLNDRGDGGVDLGHVRVSHLITSLHYSHPARVLTRTDVVTLWMGATLFIHRAVPGLHNARPDK